MAQDTDKEFNNKIVEAIQRFEKALSVYHSTTHHYGDFELYYAEEKILRYIGDNKDVMSVDIWKHFNITSSACAQFVKKLKDKGLIKQKTSPDDSRCKFLYLTDLGREAYEGGLENDRQWAELCAEEFKKYTNKQKKDAADLIDFISDCMFAGDVR